MSDRFSESVVEDAALAWLEALGWEIEHGPAIAAGEPRAERLVDAHAQREDLLPLQTVPVGRDQERDRREQVRGDAEETSALLE